MVLKLLIPIGNNFCDIFLYPKAIHGLHMILLILYADYMLYSRGCPGSLHRGIPGLDIGPGKTALHVHIFPDYYKWRIFVKIGHFSATYRNL